jgi:hypothetical protein
MRVLLASPDPSEGEKIGFAVGLINQFVDAVNRGDRDEIQAMSVLGIAPARVVSRYCDTLESVRPVRVLSMSVVGPVERRHGPRWAPWVVYDRVRVIAVMECSKGQTSSNVDVWVYASDGGMSGQLASRLIK